MAIILGWGGGKANDRGEVAPGLCRNGNNNVLFHYVVSKKSFRLYFVPVARYGTHHYLNGSMNDQQYLAAVRFFWEGQMTSQGALAPLALPAARG